MERKNMMEKVKLKGEGVREALRAFMQWIYTRLEAEYDYLQSDDAIKESIGANEYEFTANGEMI